MMPMELSARRLLDVVIVDDNEAFTSAVVSMLGGVAGVRVVDCVATAAAVMPAVDQRRPHVILVDVALPDGSGIEVTRVLKSFMPELEIVVMTLSANPAYEREAMAAGARAFISKPQLATEIEPLLRGIAKERIGVDSLWGVDGGPELERLEGLQRVELAGVLAAGLVHDLAAPLTALNLNASLVGRALVELDARARSMGGSPEATEAAARGLDAAHALQEVTAYMQHLTRDFGRLVRGMPDERRAEQPKPATAHVRSTAETALRHARPVVGGRASLHVRIPEDLDPEAAIAAPTLVRVLVNLVLNAADAFPPGRAGATIEISATPTEGGVAVDVVDNAGGVPAQVADRLFQPFVSEKWNKSGLGLGLTVSRALLRQAGGDLLLVASGPEETRFRCLLPAARTAR
jgi:signal transduction histidine kinase